MSKNTKQSADHKALSNAKIESAGVILLKKRSVQMLDGTYNQLPMKRSNGSVAISYWLSQGNGLVDAMAACGYTDIKVGQPVVSVSAMIKGEPVVFDDYRKLEKRFAAIRKPARKAAGQKRSKAAMFCTECGKKTTATAKFCANCGKPIS